MPENLVGASVGPQRGGALEKSIQRGSILKKLIRLFRTNTVVKHHFQVGGSAKPQGTARAFFKNAYSFQSSVIPGYSAYDRFARYSDYAEMESYPVLANALNIFADEVMQKNEEGKIIQVVSEKKAIQKTIQELFDSVLHLNGKNGWKLVRNLLKYGDTLFLLDITEENGVVNLIQMPANEVEREEGFDRDDPSAIRFRWTAKQNIEIPNAYTAHFRLDGNDMFHPYGQCQKYNTRVLTKDGIKEIRNIEVGDYVCSFDSKEQRKVFSKVLDTVCSGKKDCYKISTRHNVLEQSAEHRTLTHRNGQFVYVSTLDLKVGDKLFLSKDHKTEKSIKIDKTKPPSNKNGYWNNIDLVPDFVTEEFAQLIGFILGDGWINASENCVSLAWGEDDEVNNYYKSLLEKFSGKEARFTYRQLGSEITNPGGISSVCVGSKMLATILKRMDFVGDVYTKRIPSWVFSARGEVKEATLQGIQDADGSEFTDKWCTRYQLELANEELVIDTKTLAQSLGYKTSNVKKRNRGVGDLIEGVEVKSREDCFYFYYYKTFNRQFKTQDLKDRKTDEFIVEPIVSIEEAGNHDVYDIYVENENHNFYANGIVVHNSVLEPARRPWRQLVLLEDAMMVYRITRAPERRVFFLDIMGVPPEDIPQVINKFNETIKKQKVVDEQGRVDLRYGATLPIWKKTPIPLLDGRTISIEELAKEYDEGKENWVYSVQDETVASAPGKVVWCGKNYTADKMIKVWLDDDSWIMTAPEHPFCVFNDNKTGFKGVRADELKPDMSLVPLYRQLHEMKICNGYERTWCHKSKKYKFTHRLVSDEVSLKEKELVQSSTDWDKNKYLVVHHKNFNKLDNDPRNLLWVGNVDHAEYHKETAIKNIAKWNKDNKIRPQVAKLNKRRNSVQSMEWYNSSDLHKEHNEIRKEAQLKSWQKNKEHRKETQSKIQISDKIINTACLAYKANPNLSRDKFGEILNTNQEYLDAVSETQNGQPKKKSDGMHIRTLLRKMGVKYTEFQAIAENNGLNHKVSRIEEVYESDDVYCMTVVGPNGEDDRHNFAANSFTKEGNVSKSAILLKNSMDEDYIIPVRGHETGTRIDTLPGGQNLGDIEDVEFIRANLFSALGIPKAFLTFDQDVKSKQVLTQEDIRFARTVSRVQEVIVSELIKIAMIHLYVKGMRGDDLVNFSIKMTNPSTVAELQKMELWRARMDLVISAREGVFDTTFIYKNFLRLSDDAIEKIKKGQIQDKMFQAKLLQIENANGMAQPGMEMGMGGMGGMDMGMGGGMGMDMGGAPGEMMGGPQPPMVPGMAETKDLTRTGGYRHASSRGLVDLTGAGDADDDPNDMDGIRRTYASPMGGREAAELENVKADLEEQVKGFRNLAESYSRPNNTSIFPFGMSEDRLTKTFGEDLGSTSGTKGMLKEAYNKNQKDFAKTMEWGGQLEFLEESSNKIIEEVYKLNK